MKTIALIALLFAGRSRINKILVSLISNLFVNLSEFNNITEEAILIHYQFLFLSVANTVKSSVSCK